jgi:hypothetical protein
MDMAESFDNVNSSETVTPKIPKRLINAMNHSTARKLARAGIHVFPVSPAKVPLCAAWRDESTTDLKRIELWWMEWTSAIVGIDCGKSGLAVIDPDRHNPSKDGVAYFAELCADPAHDVLPAHPITVTYSDGNHHIFKQPDGEPIRNAGQLNDRGINVRGVGGFIVAPGSVIGAGSTLYDGSTSTEDGAWVSDRSAPGLAEEYEAGTLAKLPDWLATTFRAPKVQPETAAPEQERHSKSADPDQSAILRFDSSGAREREWAEAALDGCYDELAGITEGDRNNRLNAIAFRLGRMVGAGWLSESDVIRRLEDACVRNGLMQSDKPKQCRDTINSGLSKGKLKPHEPLPEKGYGDARTGEWFDTDDATAEPKPKISATPFEWIEPSQIPPREWLYGKHYIRKFTSMTAALGGIGKSSLDLVEILAMVTGRDLLNVGYKPERKLRAWIWNGEDPKIEVQRRIAAVCKRYGIKKEELDGYLFLDSGRDTEIKIAYQERSKGFKIAVPVVEQVTQTILDNQIDVMLVDPFISSHALNENDTTSIDAAAKEWAKIADKTDSAIEFIHHMRKGAPGQRNHEVGDARGASSSVDAVRSARVVNVMDKETADLFGIDTDERDSYLRVTTGKPNMAKKSRKGDWYYLESVNLGNATHTREADEVGVVVGWKPPSDMDETTGGDIDEILRRIGDAPIHREDSQAKMWAGKVVADVLGLDATQKDAKERIKKILKGCVTSGQLKFVPGEDANRKMRRYLVKGQTAVVADELATH